MLAVLTLALTVAALAAPADPQVLSARSDAASRDAVQGGTIRGRITSQDTGKPL